MTVFKKALAVFLAVITAFSALAISVFAENVSYYTIETYFMNTRGLYGIEADETSRKYAAANSQVNIEAEEQEGFTLDASKSDASVTVNEDGSTVARIYYQRNQYDLTYYYEDQIGPQTEKSLVYYGAEIPGFEANPSGKPTKRGYNFIMWSTDPEERADAPEIMPANDVALYPVYEAKTFTYTFDAGEGAAFPNGQQILTYEYAFGDTTVTPDDPVMEHYEFAGWDLDIPPVVDTEGNKEFYAMYNELTYLVIFMDGEEELSYSDGYYFGDIVEEEDVPEGYEAWTLSDGTYAQFPYEVKGDTYFYAAEAPVEYTASFYTDINDSEPYAIFSGIAGSEIEFPEDPVRKGYKFIGWSSDVTVMPDEDIDFIAEWEETASALPDNYLGLKTELYTYDETVSDWVVADKVGRNQEVKARVFIETGFPAGDGMILFFYNDDAFESDYVGGMFEPEINYSEGTAAYEYGLGGLLAGSPYKSSTQMKRLVERGYITDEFLENNTPITFSFSFSDFKCHKISGDEWFVEFDLRTKSDAVGSGDFFIVPSTIQNPDEGYYAYTTFARGESEGVSSLDYTLGMDMWKATCAVESKPVSTGYGRLILDAGEGAFDDGSSVMKLDFVAGSEVDVYPEPTRDGYYFDGYEPDIPDTIDAEIIRLKAKWIPADDTPYNVIVHYVDFEDGETIYNEDMFEFAGVTGSTVEIVEVMPESPETDTEYILVEDLLMNDYNVVDVAADNIISGVIAADGSTVLEIYFKLASYEVEFYADGGSFPDGKNIAVKEAIYGTPALSIVPEDEPRRRGFVFAGWHGVDESEYILGDTVYYALWEAEKYDYNVFFLSSGDTPEGFTLPDSYVATEGDFIIVPEAYSAEGYVFEGWYYNGKRYESGSQIMMPANNITFVCRWKLIPVETTTQPTTKPTTTQPVVTETTTTKPTTTQPVVTETTTTKPTTTQPIVTEITTTKPTTTQPVVTETTTTKPTTTQPVVTETTTTKPTTTQPVVTETTTTKPTTTQPVVTEPTTTKPTTTQPVVTETTTTKPTTTQPVVTETTTTKPTTTQPVVTEPTTKPAEPTTKPQIALFEIRKPSVTTIKYGDSIILHLDVIEGELPKDAKIIWSVNNDSFKIISTAIDGSNCMITPNAKGDSVITVTVFDKDGNEIGSDTQTMTSKAGFFQKLIAFFKKLFGLTKVIPEAFKSVFDN